MIGFSDFSKNIIALKDTRGADAARHYIEATLAQAQNTDSFSPHMRGLIFAYVAFQDILAGRNYARSKSLALLGLDLEPKNWRAYYVLAQDALFCGHKNRLEHYLNQALDIVPSHRGLLLKYIDFYLGNNRPAPAAKRLEAANLDPADTLYVDLRKRIEICSRKETQSDRCLKGHVMLAGISHCGSTFFGNFLMAHKQCHYIGESHRLIMLSQNARGSAGLDAGLKYVPCYVCAPRPCTMFTNDFRDDLAENTDDFYSKIIDRTAADIVIFGDKNYSITRKFDPRGSFKEIVLFKRFENAYLSHYKRREGSPTDGSPRQGDRLRTPGEYATTYATNYANLLNEVRSPEQCLYLNWESFCLNIDRHLPILSDFLGVNLNKNLLGQFSIADHSFGGNSDVNAKLREKDSQLQPMKPNSLPAKIIREIHGLKQSKIVQTRLMAAYKISFKF